MNLTPEERDDLATAALLANRRNRPRGTVVLAAIVAGIAAIALLVSLASVAGAAGAHAKRLRQLERTQELVARHRGLEMSGDPGGQFDRNPTLLSTMEQLAIRAGLDKPAVPSRTPEGRGPIQETRIKYNTFRVDDIENVMRWIDSVVTEVDGVRVHELRIDPQPTSWTVDVTFSRWERQS